MLVLHWFTMPCSISTSGKTRPAFLFHLVKFSSPSFSSSAISVLMRARLDVLLVTRNRLGLKPCPEGFTTRLPSLVFPFKLIRFLSGDQVRKHAVLHDGLNYHFFLFVFQTAWFVRRFLVSVPLT